MRCYTKLRSSEGSRNQCEHSGVATRTTLTFQ
jgi:hypothetical protein